MKSKRNYSVFLYGIFTVNLGDDLFFKIILERYPNTRFVVYAPMIYKHILSPYCNCIILSDSDFPLKLLRKISSITHISYNIILYFYIFLKYKIRVFLIAGGSLFIEGNSNIPRLVRKLNQISYLLPKFKKCIIGSNFGPCRTDEWKNIVSKSLESLDDICFRDLYSYVNFSNLGNVRYGNDIVMHSTPDKEDCKNKILCVNIRSVVGWPTLNPNKDKYLTNTKKIITHYQSKGYSIKLISFCQKYGDCDITDELYNMLNNKNNVDRLYYHGNIQECVDIIASSDTMIATRFHAIILALVHKIKLIPISYSIKSENMLKSLDLWKYSYDYNEYCCSSIDIILSNIIDSYNIDITKNTQFEYLDKILKNI